ncbi:hypothetical protein PILCRDRAFT_343143 [Piloderma croceum F 1598]|uniref:Uncharacterized protein n=1 Tax=Piloderma croceum (strain F 1598) TaxID=765440 RepID=A0A0C3G1N1_PILCF|nr:hypothetical protein PILCRDRAFT_343143 [Piloderma croceum F 1598]
MPDRSQSQYAAASRVPLIKSPSLRVPRPVELPPDIHPLPDSVTPYFVYPYTLEPHILTLESSRRSTQAAHASRREAYLRAREEEKERRKRDKLRKIAPGFEPTGAVLVPVHLGGNNGDQATGSAQGTESGSLVPERERDVMDDLVDQLAALESKSSGGS